MAHSTTNYQQKQSWLNADYCSATEIFRITRPLHYLCPVLTKLKEEEPRLFFSLLLTNVLSSFTFNCENGNPHRNAQNTTF